MELGTFLGKNRQMALSQCIKRRHLAQKNLEFHTGVKKCRFGNFSERVCMAVPCYYWPSKRTKLWSKIRKDKKKQFIHSPISMACSITSLSGIKALGNKIELFRILTRHSFISFRLFLAYISSINLDMDCMLLSANLFNCPLSCFSNRLVSLLPEIK